MSTKSRTYTLITDPGHGWLSVPHADILALGIANDITGFSYMTHSRAYLEEDCDAPRFLRAAESAGWHVTIKEGRGNARKEAPVRNYGPFDAKLLGRIRPGLRFVPKWRNFDVAVYSVRRGGSAIVCAESDGFLFRVPLNSFSCYVESLVD